MLARFPAFAGALSNLLQFTEVVETFWKRSEQLQRLRKCPLHRWRLPRAVRDLLLRDVKAQRQLERTRLRCWQPVALVGCARRFALDVQRQRSVRPDLAVAAVAKRV